MRNGKYKKTLNIFLIIISIAIISIILYFVYEAIVTWSTDSSAEEEVSDFENAIKQATVINYEEEQNVEEPQNPEQVGGNSGRRKYWWN